VLPSVAPGHEPPWWMQEAGVADEPKAPPLRGDAETDVAIVGGGYTGLWTALALRDREPGLRVTILEAEVCGAGPSGRNGGFLHGYWSSLGRLRERLGDAAALELARAGDRIVPAVREFCDRAGEDVWLRVGGMLKVSASPAQDPMIDSAVAAAHELGVADEAVALDRDALAERCRSPVFRRGVFFRDGATVQPARLVRTLRRAALANGLGVHEGSTVRRLFGRDPVVLETTGGRVRAHQAVLAVNAAATGWRPAARRLTNFGSYVVLTEPVPELLAGIGWTGGEAIVDARMFLHYFRTTADGRVLMGSGSGPIGFGGRLDGRFTRDSATAARAEAGLRRLLPELAPARVTHAWGGPIDVSSDQLPFFGTVPGSRVHYGVGYSGNGVGPSWLGGQILASLVLGAEDEWTRLPLVHRTVPPLPPEPLKRLGGGLVRAGILRVEEAEDAGRRVPLVARAVAALPRAAGLRVGTR
jgi:glycine/D-amino acid oxidase-like deaminating enzyme